MKFKLLATCFLSLGLVQIAEATPVSTYDTDARFQTVRDGCGPGYYRGRHGDCYRERREPEWRPWERPRYDRYERPREERWERPRRACPPGYHLGRQSGVCRPDYY